MDRTNRRAALALSATLALAAPLVVAGSAHATSADEPPSVLVAADAPATLSAEVADAARAAQRDIAKSRALEQGLKTPADAELDAALDTLVAGGAVGVTARVETPSDTWSGAAGTREREGRAPAKPRDRFRAASNTKPMVATLVMQEVEKGTWTLDTPVEDVLPGVMPAGVTIEQLLSHRSGAPTATNWIIGLRMTDPTSLDEYFEVTGQEVTPADHIEALQAAPWVHEPGTDFSYSNAGYVVLGLMLEEVTGRSVENLLEHRVFAPAGMRQSAYPDDPGVRGPFLHESAYTGPEGAGWYDLDHFDPSLFAAAGAVTSTTEDLADFTEALVTNRLVAPGTTADMLDPRTAGGAGYGLGVYRVPDPCVPGGWLYGHDGASLGTLSFTFTSPDGERQVSMGVTGRDNAYPVYTDEPLYDWNSALLLLMEATC
ncbi:D-alanyl-D-alanine carboxypeptidase [Promicromonospora umidemergens]|uniref:Beta-lactamase-related domain-containing protein n=1 Tax=Promicromonospora umidemergens TaxID=629679 RepID=A0ABP8WWT9_9MICO|nr:serine hydrolase domain-containing protein [Promicromonospora umidemergens]MCP2283564.1 D-alanyl-D-alanine carboxypeptidase [Promicromonospora umidemergens]